MTSSKTPDPIDREAADWFARLNARTVSVSDLEAFRAWRAEPGRREAYEAVEAVWRTTAPLADDADVRSMIDQAVARRRPSSRRAWIFGGTAIAAGFAVAVGMGVWLETRADVWSTEPGETRAVRLADGSMLTLDTASKVRVRLGADARRLELIQGQAQFVVAHDRRRPFTVTAGETSVIATGTRFDVRREGQKVRITLVEGGVTVAEGAGAAERRWTLAPGQQMVTTDGQIGARPIVRRVDTAAATSWTGGRLTFDETPLAEAVQEVNRYGGTPLKLGDGVDGRRPISGAFDVADKSAFIEAVALLYGLTARSGSDAVTLVRPAPEEKS